MVESRELFIEDPFAEPTGYWWLLLTIVGALNLLIAAAYLCYIRNQPKSVTSKKVIVCGIAYIFMCAWRGFLPVVNTSRRCFWDTDFGTPIVSRSLATVGEMCFIIIFSIIYAKIWKDLVAPITGVAETITLVLIWSLIPLIAIAQVLAWLGVTTQNNLYNAVEVILWTLGFSYLLILSVVTLCFFTPESQSVKRLLTMTVLLSIGFVGFEVGIDIPRYFADLTANPGNFTSFTAGAEEMTVCQEVTRTLEAWESDIPWQTGYFTFGAWWCMMLVAWNQRYDMSREEGSTTVPPANYSGAGTLI